MDVAQRAMGEPTSAQYTEMRNNMLDGKAILSKPSAMDYALSFVNLNTPITYGGEVAGTVGLLQKGDVGMGVALGTLTAARYLTGVALNIWYKNAYQKSQSELHADLEAHPGRTLMSIGSVLALAAGCTGMNIASTVKLLQTGDVALGAVLIASLVVNSPISIRGKTIMGWLRLPNKERDLFEKDANEHSERLKMEWNAKKHWSRVEKNE